MKRRTFLATGALVGGLSTGGCLSRFGIGGDAENSGGDHEESEENEDGGSGEDNHDEQADDEQEDDSTGATDEADGRDEEEGEDEDDEESDGVDEEEEEEDPEDQLTPDEEDIEPNRDEYERHERREYEERSEDDVEVTAEAHDDGTVVTVEGSVENVSDEPIDAVDLDSSLYGPGDEYLGATRTSVQELAPGESEAFESSTEAGDVVGEIEYIDMAATVYEYSEN